MAMSTLMEDTLGGGLFSNEATILAASSMLLCVAIAWVFWKDRISAIKPAMDPEKFLSFRLSKVKACSVLMPCK
jgi:hypothetical protein